MYFNILDSIVCCDHCLLLLKIMYTVVGLKGKCKGWLAKDHAPHLMHLEAGAIGLREAISQGFVSGMRKIKNELM
jgi:hypothetical protein